MRNPAIRAGQIAAFLFVGVCLTVTLWAQSRARYGNFLGGNLRALEPEKPKPPPQPVYRFVTNQLFDITKSRLWEQHDVVVQESLTNAWVGYLFTERGIDGDVMVLNVGAVPTSAQYQITAIALGLTNWQGRSLKLLDCGITPEENARRKAAVTNSIAPIAASPAKP